MERNIVTSIVLVNLGKERMGYYGYTEQVN